MMRRAAQGAHTGAHVAPTVTFEVHFRAGARGRRRMRTGTIAKPKPMEPGHIPRISRLMALAIHFDGLIRKGAVRGYADIARLGGVSKARVSQIMDLLTLAPEIQEEILFLPRVVRREAVTERGMRSVEAQTDWEMQRRSWARLGHPKFSGDGSIPQNSPLPPDCPLSRSSQHMVRKRDTAG